MLVAPAEVTSEPEVRISGDALIARAGAELDLISKELLDLEEHLMETRGNDAEAQLRPQIQSLDLIVQKIAGLAKILRAASKHMEDCSTHDFDSVVDLPRLGSLATALRGDTLEAQGNSIELF